MLYYSSRFGSGQLIIKGSEVRITKKMALILDGREVGIRPPGRSALAWGEGWGRSRMGGGASAYQLQLTWNEKHSQLDWAGSIHQRID